MVFKVAPKVAQNSFNLYLKISSQSFLMTRKKIVSLSSKYLHKDSLVYVLYFSEVSQRSVDEGLSVSFCSSIHVLLPYGQVSVTLFGLLRSFRCWHKSAVADLTWSAMVFKISLELSASDFSCQSIKNSRYFKTFSFYL